MNERGSTTHYGTRIQRPRIERHQAIRKNGATGQSSIFRGDERILDWAAAMALTPLARRVPRKCSEHRRFPGSRSQKHAAWNLRSSGRHPRGWIMRMNSMSPFQRTPWIKITEHAATGPPAFNQWHHPLQLRRRERSHF
jgi:hypothetical protein